MACRCSSRRNSSACRSTARCSGRSLSTSSSLSPSPLPCCSPTWCCGSRSSCCPNPSVVSAAPAEPAGSARNSERPPPAACRRAPDRIELRQFRDDPARPLARGHTLDIVETVAEARRPGLPRRARRMPRERNVGQGEERMVRLRGLLHEDVEAGPRDLLLGERAMEGVLVHHRSAARIDENGTRLHKAELARAHHVARAVREGYVQADHVRGAQELLEEHEACTQRVLLVLVQAHDVVVLDLHVEGGGPPRDLLADIAQ